MQAAANLLQRAKKPKQLFDENTPKDLVRATRLSRKNKPVDWRRGDVKGGRHGRLSEFMAAFPPGVHVQLESSGSVSIRACCGPGDRRQCNYVKEAATLAAKLNPEIQKQIKGDAAMLRDLKKSLDVLGRSDVRLRAVEDAAVPRVEDLSRSNGRGVMMEPLGIVQESLDECTRQMKAVGLQIQASLPAADPKQWALMLGGRVGVPQPLRSELAVVWRDTVDRFGSAGHTRVLGELDAALWSCDLYPRIFDALGVDIRPAPRLAVIKKWYRAGSLLQDAVLESSVLLAPIPVFHYGKYETNIFTGTAATFCSIAAREQCFYFERYCLWRSLYEKARRAGTTACFADDVLCLLAGTRTSAYYDYVDAKKKEDETAADADDDAAMA